MAKLSLPLEINPKSYYEAVREKNSKYEDGQLLVKCADYVLNNYDNLPGVLPLNYGVIRINPNFYIYSLAGEPGINIQTVLRESVPDVQLLCFGYNDAIAYVPSDKMIEEGGYEADTSVTEYRLKGRIAPGVDKLFCGSLKNAIADMNK